MSRFCRIVAAVLVSGVLAACGSDRPPETVTVPTPTAGGVTAPGASSSPGGGGFASVDQAVARHLSAASGARYVGQCAQAKPDPDAVCAIKMATVDEGDVYGVGAPSSEVVGFLLLREGPDGWRVVDDHVPGEPDASIPTWMAGLD
ncbi:hypothetical protein ACGF5C_21105 [Micromonospora sp. NPDC047620]|uniref:hypothetical protein n=1 Tax=Micromonospora sp. NPDC047620 TaxID=3364251 RepID=UPI003716B86B